MQHRQDNNEFPIHSFSIVINLNLKRVMLQINSTIIIIIVNGHHHHHLWSNVWLQHHHHHGLL